MFLGSCALVIICYKKSFRSFRFSKAKDRWTYLQKIHMSRKVAYHRLPKWLSSSQES